MRTIFNSDNYCVVLFPETPQGPAYEIMDKQGRREVFVDGDLAQAFKHKVSALMAEQPGEDEIDQFLAQFDGLMQTRLVFH
ncbi:MAG TPA: DUF3567 family protein [Burkholderiaceae bacterium]|nr:DUF3567 family protein [Burkholderiaceae bacterium]